MGRIMGMVSLLFSQLAKGTNISCRPRSTLIHSERHQRELLQLARVVLDKVDKSLAVHIRRSANQHQVGQRSSLDRAEEAVTSQ